MFSRLYTAFIIKIQIFTADNLHKIGLFTSCTYTRLIKAFTILKRLSSLTSKSFTASYLHQIDRADYLFSLQISTNYTHPDLDYLHQIIYARQVIYISGGADYLHSLKSRLFTFFKIHIIYMK